ncbi:MAG TPA: hypothetical protein EYP14_04115 [Planctomycetaceae bacterium]|nr:hypothetical protein [Planctomycetaceae bacterium]
MNFTEGGVSGRRVTAGGFGSVVPFGWPLWIVLVFLFLYGAVLGSFLNVCIYRIPQHDRFWPSLLGLWSPPSYCPRCGNRIPRSDNLPIIGWLKLRGRCRFCRGWISIRYPAIELFNALLFVIVYWMEVPGGFYPAMDQSCLYTGLGPFGVSGSFWFSPTAIVNWRYAYHMALFEALIVATFIDFDLRIIPDGVTVPGMTLGLLGGWALGRVWLVPVWFQDPSVTAALRAVLPEGLQFLATGPRVPEWIATHPHWHGLAVSAAGLVVGGGVIWIVRAVGQFVLRREAMGFGDVTLMAMIGSFLGWQPTLVVFFVAPVIAMAVVLATWLVARPREIPYGPYLSLAALGVVLGWKRMWPLVERVFSMGVVLILMAAFMVAMLFLTLQLIQLGKRLLGIPPYDEYWTEEWTSADQLLHFAGETVDPQQGQWQRSLWPGELAARGLLREQQWRSRLP